MYAVIDTGGKQYRVTEGDVVFLERLAGDTGDEVIFDKVLACSNEDETDFGKPYLGGASVEARILGHGKDKKIVIFKYKAKKRYRKKQGHRQPYTKVRIERIISDRFGVAAYVAEDEDISGAPDDIEIIEAELVENAVEGGEDDADAAGGDEIELEDVAGANGDTDEADDSDESDDALGGEDDSDESEEAEAVVEETELEDEDEADDSVKEDAADAVEDGEDDAEE